MGRARGSNDDPVFTKFTAAALAEGGGAKAINLADGTGTGSRQSLVVRTSNCCRFMTSRCFSRFRDATSPYNEEGRLNAAGISPTPAREPPWPLKTPSSSQQQMIRIFVPLTAKKQDWLLGYKGE
jgi:hypothetical protein